LLYSVRNPRELIFPRGDTVAVYTNAANGIVAVEFQKEPGVARNLDTGNLWDESPENAERESIGGEVSLARIEGRLSLPR
jgi:hypothetical protein